MRTPLMKRVPRELIGDWHKYIVIIVFMVFMIGVVSAMYVGHDSMKAAIENTQATGDLEDGRFETDKELTDDQIDAIEKDVTITEHFYRNEDEDQDNDGISDATIRVFKSDSKVDRATFNEGREPQSADEIAIDRMHADNVGLNIGDTVTLSNHEFEIVGLLSYVNYTTLHENNTDLIFDAFGFDVGMVTPEAFDKLKSRLHYNYVFMYVNKPEGDVEKADASKDVMEDLLAQLIPAGIQLEDYVPEYMNQSSNFAPSDIDGDTAGASVLIFILIAVIAFIFGITISTTIDKEASVIGTLRASGYTRGELTRHYMMMPLIVTLVGAIIGNAMGYTVFKNIVVNLYYNSYSLPKYETVWSTTAFIKTTIIPLALMLFINLFVITRKLCLSPLKFLRHDLKKTKRAKAVRLPSWKFISRFRLRVLLQNIPNYLILAFGVIFVEIMLCFAFGFPDSLTHYANEASDMLFTPYQYILTNSTDVYGNEITTDADGAERFSMVSLEQNRVSDSKPMRGAGSDTESVSVYGYSDSSKYIFISEDIPKGSVFISTAYANKYKIAVGDTINLSGKYEDKEYSFDVEGIYEYDGALAAFMPKESFDDVFDKKPESFTGYFSKEEITDIDERYIAGIITQEDVAKISNQLMHSMGGFMNFFKYALLAMSISLIYLLSKIIIEKNENAISMCKILGFKNGEIASIYMMPTAILVVIFTGVSLFIGKAVIAELFKVFMMQMDGWFTFWISLEGMIGSVLFILIGYAIVSIFDYRRISRIPMEDALKNVE